MEISVADFAKKYNFEIISGCDGVDNTINNVYVCDLLSWVMGRAKENSAWITIQGHINVVAVALLVNASCIIIAEGSIPDEKTIQKSNDEGIPILTTVLNSYDVTKIFAGIELGIEAGIELGLQI